MPQHTIRYLRSGAAIALRYEFGYKDTTILAFSQMFVAILCKKLHFVR